MCDITDEVYRESVFLAAISDSYIKSHSVLALVQSQLRGKASFADILKTDVGNADDADSKEIKRAISVLAQFEELTRSKISLFRKTFPGPSVFSILAGKSVASARVALKKIPRTSLLFTYYDTPVPNDDEELQVNIDLWSDGAPCAILLIVALYNARRGTLGLPNDLASAFIKVGQSLLDNSLERVGFWEESVTTMLAHDKGKPSIAGVETVYKRNIVKILQELDRLFRTTQDQRMAVFLYSKGYRSLLEISKAKRDEFVSAVKTANTAWKDKAVKLYDHSVDVVSKAAYHGVRIIQRMQRTGLSVLDHRDPIELSVTLAVKGQLDPVEGQPGQVTEEMEPSRADYVPLTYENLFGSHMVATCPHGCNNVLSPTAYFIDLMQFLRYSTSSPLEGRDAERFSVLTNLLARRPDLEHLELSCENLIATLPYIDLANEVMESWIYSRMPDEAKFLVKDEEAAAGRSMVQSKPRDLPSTRLATRNNRAKQTSAELLARPGMVVDEVYRHRIGEVVYPVGIFPYSYAFDTIRVILKAMGTSRSEVISLFDSEEPQARADSQLKITDTLYARTAAAEHFGIINQEFLAITGQGLHPSESDHSVDPLRKKVHEYWGYPSMSDLQSKSESTYHGLAFIKDQFLVRSSLRLKELAEILTTRFFNSGLSENDRIILAVPSDHDLRSVRLQRNDGKELSSDDWDCFQRFIRLWKAVKCSLRDLDMALSIINVLEGIAPRLITPSHVLNLHVMYQVSDLAHLSLKETLNFWTHLLVSDKTISAEEALLFLEDHEVRMGQHARSASVTAILRITASDLAILIACNDEFGGHGGMSNEPTGKNVAQAYRMLQLCKVLGLSVAELPKLAKTSFKKKHSSPFTNPAVTLAFTKQWKEILASGINLQDLLKIDSAYEKEADKIEALLPLDQRPDIQRSCRLIYDLQKARDEVEQRYPVLSGASTEDVQRLASAVFDTATVARIITFLEGGPQVDGETKQERQTNRLQPARQKGTSNEFWSPKTKGEAPVLQDVATGTAPGTGATAESEKMTTETELTEGEQRTERIQFYHSTLWDILSSYPGTGELLNKNTDAAAKRLLFCNALSSIIKKKADEAATLTAISASGIRSPDVAVLRALVFDMKMAGPEGAWTVEESLQRTRLDAYAVEASKASASPSGANLSTNLHQAGTTTVETRSFDGFIIPVTSEKYRFVVSKRDSASVQIYLNGKVRALTASQDADQCCTDFITLEAGNIYSVRLVNTEVHQLVWRAVSTGDLKVDKSAFIVARSVQEAVEDRVLSRLEAAALVAERLRLSLSELAYIHNDNYRFKSVTFGRLSYQGLELLLSFKALNDHSKLDLVTFFKVVERERKALISDPWSIELIARTFNVSQSKVGQVVLAAGTALKLGEALTLEFLLKIQKQFSMLDRLQQWDVDLQTLETAAFPGEYDEYGVANTLRTTYDMRTENASWLAEAGSKVYDPLRASRRKVLSTYLLQQPELQKQGVREPDQLFEYFLIDTQMGPDLQTSRIRQAVSTIQLFVQRCLLGLEVSKGVPITAIDAKRWDWMRKYSVWEANRRIFLYPENWIDPSLRDNKSEIWSKFEAGLQHNNLTSDAVHAGLQTYVSSLHDIRSLSIQGVYKELENHPFPGTVLQDTVSNGSELKDGYPSETSQIKAIHYFGRTISAPYLYFYCKWQAKTSTWTSWEKMEVDITTHEFDMSGSSASVPLAEPSTFLVPAVWRNRLIVFLPEFRVCTVQGTASSKSGDTKSPPTLDGVYEEVGKRSAIHYYEIRISWTEYRHGKWTPLQTTSPLIISNCDEDEYVGKKSVESWKPTFTPKTVPQVLPSLKEYTFYTGVLGQCAGGYAADTTLCLNVSRKSKGVICSLVMNGGYLQKSSKLLSRSSDLPGVELGLSFSRYPFSDGSVGVCSYQDMRVDSKLVKYHAGSKDREMLITTTSLPDKVGSTSDGWISQQLYNELSPALLRSSLSNNFEDIYHVFSEQWGHVSSECFGNGKGTLMWHEMRSPYSGYNWEIGIHAPMLLMDRLLKSQQFDLALKMAQCIFNPQAEGGSAGQGLASCWNWPVFFQISAEEAMASALGKYNPTLAEAHALETAVEEWRSSPFQPYVIARGRPLAYMKWVVIKYLEILVAYGDSYFRQNSFDTLPIATQLYVQASHIYGTPEVQPINMAEMDVQSYGGLRTKVLDSFSDSVVDMSYHFPFRSAEPVKETGLRAARPNVTAETAVGIANLAATRYFSVPLNPKIAEIGSIIHDRLTKIRSCLDINGVPIKVPLFDPPIEPGLLVQAVSKGGLGAISSLSDSLSQPMPNYRFVYTFQRAVDLCQEMKALASTYLSIREKRDAEALSILRGQQDSTIASMTLKLKQLAIDDAKQALETLKQSRQAAESRMSYYLRLTGESASRIPGVSSSFTEIEQEIDTPTGGSLRMTPEEIGEFALYGTAEALRISANADKVRAGVFKILPKVEAEVQPMGVGASTAFDPAKIAAGIELVSEIKNTVAAIATFGAGSLSRISTLKSQLRERRLQANIAGYEIKSIDAQIVNQKLKVSLAEQDLEVQKKQIENAKACEEFLRSKYTNEQLYTWMDNTFQQYLYQTYSLAFDMAKAAEKTYAFEKGEESISYIKFGYWGSGNYGIGCAEDLWLSLKRMEVDYLAKKAHDYEITKNVSLRQLSPTELFRLRDSGKADLDIPESLFDLDFPGHYARGIKSVSVSLMCIIGPYTSISCVLRLASHRYRISATTAIDYPEQKSTDSRFRTMQVPIQSIATSSAQNDAGVFELQFRDDRYIPFEGAGAVSKWSLELPNKYRQFNYASISDVILHIKYTSKDGGELLKQKAEASIATSLSDPNLAVSQLVIDVPSDFSTDWYRFCASPTEEKERKIPLTNLRRMLPYLAVYVGMTVTKVQIYTTFKGKDDDKITGTHTNLETKETSKGDLKHIQEEHGLHQYSAAFKDLEKQALGNLELIIKGALSKEDKFYVILDYCLKKPS